MLRSVFRSQWTIKVVPNVLRLLVIFTVDCSSFLVILQKISTNFQAVQEWMRQCCSWDQNVYREEMGERYAFVLGGLAKVPVFLLIE